MRTLFLLFATAALAACGGAQEAAQTSAAPATGPAAAPAPASSPTGAAPDDPSPPAAAPASPDITCGLANFEGDALRIVNHYRSAGANCRSQGSFASAPALVLEARLTRSAYGHARDMADRNYFSHDSLDGRSMVDRVDAVGYAWSTIGENIAAGYDNVQSVVDGWMASDGHCANLMNPRFTEFGLACARNDASTYRIYWTQNLGRP